MKTWIEKLNASMTAAFFNAFSLYDNPQSVIASVVMGDGSYIDVELFRNNDVNVWAYHADRKNERECPNITAYIEDSLIGWNELKEQYDDAQPEDEWTAHGFRNEADYWHYRLG